MIEVKSFFGASFVHKNGKNYIRFNGEGDILFRLEEFIIADVHKKDYEKFLNLVERKKKLEKLLS